MKIFDLRIGSSEGLWKEIAETKFYPALKTHTLNYPRNYFKCGCFEQAHNVADPKNSVVVSAPTGVFGTRFVIRCGNDYVTLVSFKGFFAQETVSDWSADVRIFNEAVEILRRRAEG